MNWEEVYERLRQARERFLEKDQYLLEVNANERSMTHKFAEYLQQAFGASWNVDCEFNLFEHKATFCRLDTETYPLTIGQNVVHIGPPATNPS